MISSGSLQDVVNIIAYKIWHEANQSEQIHSFVSIKSISYDLVDYYVSTKDLHYENLNPLQHVGIVITI